MSQLFTRDLESFQEWSTGSACYFFDYTAESCRYLVGVKCKLGDNEADEMALLDTAAEWSVVGEDTAELLELPVESPAQQITMNTRRGDLHGGLYRIPITLLAESGFGRDLVVEGTVFVSKDWDGPVVLGYRGFLERLRIAIDPGSRLDEARFFFGKSA